MNAEETSTISPYEEFDVALPRVDDSISVQIEPIAFSATNIAAYRLGPLILDARHRILLRDQVPVRLGERAVSILLMLVERAARLVTKEELLAAAWNGLAVEDGNLTVQVAALRRALGEVPGGGTWIETLPRRGYRFTGPTVRLSALPNASGALAKHRDGSADRIPTIAVLPFRSVGDRDSPVYFVNGLVEEIISMLAGLRELTVLSAGSTLKYRDGNVNARLVGQELGVHYIVSGSVRYAGERMRLIAELTDAASNRVLWSQSFDAHDRQLFEAQDNIVARIVHTLTPKVHEAELRRVRAQRPEDMGAYHLVLQARDLIYRLERPAFDEAETLLLRAIKRDPGYAAAWFLIARWHSLRAGNGWSADRKADAGLVEQALKRAIALDGGNAPALAYYGHNKARLSRDYDTALALFDRALEIAPNEAGVWGWSSATFSYLGDGEETIRRAERALGLSPFDPFAHHYRAFLCLGHYTNGTYAQAVKWGRATMLLQPSDGSNLRYTTASLAALGRIDEAKAIAERILVIEPDMSVAELIARHPYRDPARRNLLGARLTEAGLPLW